MATFKNFSDITGEAIELGALVPVDNPEFSRRWPGVKGMRCDGYSKWAARPITGGDLMPVTRRIEMKANPSRHECSAKCLSGAHNGRCECQCGGKNHGRGLFTALLAA